MLEVLKFQYYLICQHNNLIIFLFLFLVIFKTFFVIPVAKENTRLKLVLTIPAGIPKILVKEIIDINSLAAVKIIKALLNNQKEQCIY